MKKISCRELGGTCDMEISGNSPNEIANKAMVHLRERHPEILENMSSESKAKWNDTLVQKWNDIPAM